jgi:carbonic anhydrase
VLIDNADLINMTVVDLHTTFEVNFITGTGSLALWDENENLQMYKMVEMHIHAPSEHTFNGINYDMELQIVHQNYEDNSIAIVAIVFDHV